VAKKLGLANQHFVNGLNFQRQGFSEFVSALKSIASFFFKHKDIALKIGGKILKSMHPLGSFLKSTVEKVVKSDLGKNLKEGLMRGLNITAEHFGKVEKVLENAAVAKVSPKHT
jgi:hypothetical protein